MSLIGLIGASMSLGSSPCRRANAKLLYLLVAGRPQTQYVSRGSGTPTSDPTSCLLRSVGGSFNGDGDKMRPLGSTFPSYQSTRMHDGTASRANALRPMTAANAPRKVNLLGPHVANRTEWVGEQLLTSRR